MSQALHCWLATGAAVALSGSGGAGSDREPRCSLEPRELWLLSFPVGQGFANMVMLILHAWAGRINWRFARLVHLSQSFSYFMVPVPLSRRKLFRNGASSGCIPFGGPIVRSVPRQAMTWMICWSWNSCWSLSRILASCTVPFPTLGTSWLMSDIKRW